MHKVQKTNSSGFTSRSSSGGAKKKERQGETQFTTKTYFFETPQVKIIFFNIVMYLHLFYRAM
jgi:hypothetical protein